MYLPAIGRTLPVLNGWSGELQRIAPCHPVTFRDVEDNDFEYEVVSLEILNPEDVEPMEEGDWDLILFPD